MSKDNIVCYGLAGLLTRIGLFFMVLEVYKEMLTVEINTKEEAALIVKILILILAIGYVITVFPVDNIAWKK